MRRLGLVVLLALSLSLVAAECEGDTATETGEGAPKTTIETVTRPNTVNLVDEHGSGTIEFGASTQYINGIYCTTGDGWGHCDYANELGLNKAQPGGLD